MNMSYVSGGLKMSSRTIPVVLVSTVLLLISSLAATANASLGSAWTQADMKAAIRALHYPKPGIRKLSCRGHGPYTCVATYRHHRRRAFYTNWQATGGWICAGAKPSTCKLLQHGFVSNTDAAFYGRADALELVLLGYVDNRYAGSAQKTSACTTTATSASCPYQVATGAVTVTVVWRQVATGYVTSGSVS